MTFIRDLMGWLGWGSHGDEDSGQQIVTDTHLNCSGDINPANGLPMAGAGLDIGGSPYGFDLHHGETWTTSSSTDDTFPL